MKLYQLIFCFSCFLLISGSVKSQEFQCNVSVQAPQLQSDREVYEEMEKAIREYLNNRKWTTQLFEQKERLKVNVVILIDSRPDITRFKGSIQIRVIRPVYNSTYETVLVNLQDKDFSITYVPFQILDFSESNYIDNLTCILNFYANIILGFDYGSFGPGGGMDYFQKANMFVSLASNSKEAGWSSFDGVRSRNKLASELIGGPFRGFQNVLYQYHRLGLDMMEKDIGKSRLNILSALKELQKMNQVNPGSYLVRLFMDAKQPEIVNIFNNAMPNEKQQLLAIMESLDAPQMNLYQKILDKN